jgi:hypothetical protein
MKGAKHQGLVLILVYKIIIMYFDGTIVGISGKRVPKHHITSMGEG